jgi:hypothetical protein
MILARLTLETTPGKVPSLLLDGKPILAYGPSPQNILTYLPRGNGNDYKDWVGWAEQFGIRNVRSYPPSIIVDDPALNLFERANDQSDKFDLNRFNEAYFKSLREACQRFERSGIIVHLQLWQAVYWKKNWQNHYYNPKNNINFKISKNAGVDEFCTIKNADLLNHQIDYVHQVLDATADIGNVFYDIMNEIGNGTANNKAWINAIIDGIVSWENEKGIDVLLTLNDEGGRRMDDFSINHPRLDFVIKDLGRYEEHVETYLKHMKPTISVRNIDFNYENEKRFYFYGKNNLETNTEQELQTRGRKYWWRMYMAGAVSAGGYADSCTVDNRSIVKRLTTKILTRIGIENQPEKLFKATYRLNNSSETHFSNFIKFTNIAGHPYGLMASSGILFNHPVANSYCLQNKQKAIIYIESPNGEAGHNYPRKSSKLKGIGLPDGAHNVLMYYPASGKRYTSSIDMFNGEGDINLPEFKDDLALLISIHSLK